MKTRTLALIAGSLVAATALAGPDGGTSTRINTSTSAPYTAAGAVDGPFFTDDFDSYSVGSNVIGQNNWVGWDLTGASHLVSDTFASSGANSCSYGSNLGDVVQDFFSNGAVIDSGTFTYSVMTYVPSAALGNAWNILLNEYRVPAAHFWSWQVNLNPLLGLVGDEANANANAIPAALVYDQWVELRVEVDLANNTYEDFYNSVSMGVGEWMGPNNNLLTNVNPSGVLKLEAIDLYSEVSADNIYMDDVLITTEGGGCYADCDGSGTLNILDYICFGDDFAAGGTYADCDGSGSLNILDYICFGDEFAAGCP